MLLSNHLEKNMTVMLIMHMCKFEADLYFYAEILIEIFATYQIAVLELNSLSLFAKSCMIKNEHYLSSLIIS